MNQNRTLVAALIAFVLGGAVGSFFAPMLGRDVYLEQENECRRKQVDVYSQLVASYKAELAEINAVLGIEPPTTSPGR